MAGPKPVRVEIGGPLFDGKADIRLKRHIEDAVRELTQLGESRLALTLRPRPAGVYLSVQQAQKGKASTGNYRRNLTAVVAGLTATITDGGVVYGPWLEGVSPRNATTRFKGYSSFRRTAQWMREQAGDVAKRHIGAWVASMKGRG